MTGRTLVALSIVALAAGCEAVPSLRFEGDGGDGGADDGSTQSDASDAGTGCQRTPTPTACCNGLIPCYGNQCLEAGACANECSMCHATDRCCPKTNGTLGCVAAMSMSPLCP